MFGVKLANVNISCRKSQMLQEPVIFKTVKILYVCIVHVSMEVKYNIWENYFTVSIIF